MLRALARAAGRFIGQVLLLVFLVAAGVGTLALANALVRWNLWGEFVFALVLTSLATWAIGQALPGLYAWGRRWLGRALVAILTVVAPPGGTLATTSLGVGRRREPRPIRPPRWWQAPIWALLIIAGVPLAVSLGLWGYVVAGVVGGVALLALGIAGDPLPEKLQPDQWLAALAVVGAMLAFGAVDLGGHRGGKEAAVVRPVAGTKQLAWRYRPLLFLDRNEEYAPMDVDYAIERTGRVEQCRYHVKEPDCTEVDAPSQVDPSYDFLKVPGDPLGPHQQTGGEQSAYYFHTVRTSPVRLYIDYWWYFAQNPNPRAKLVLCGPGFQGSGVTCFQHDADWEGVTVVLAPCDVAPEQQSTCVPFGRGHVRVHVVAVQYAQHRGVVRFRWNWLRERRTDIEGERPLVYVAHDSHASYPIPCPAKAKRDCGIESSYDGAIPWGNNDDARCGNICLAPLPLAKDGTPLQWNAFPGPWGYRKCILWDTYCDRAEPPRAPPFQRRYRDPDHVDEDRPSGDTSVWPTPRDLG